MIIIVDVLTCGTKELTCFFVVALFKFLVFSSFNFTSLSTAYKVVWA